MFADGEADIDQVVGDHSETDPALHPIITSIAATVEAVATLADADAALAPGAPSLNLTHDDVLIMLLE